MSVKVNNLERAEVAWGNPLPEWVGLLARACDRTSQRVVADELGKSSGYISRVLSRSYAGDMAEAERIVRAALSADQVACPVWPAPIPLASCIENRRRPRQRMTSATAIYARVCAACPFNTDRVDQPAEQAQGEPA